MKENKKVVPKDSSTRKKLFVFIRFVYSRKKYKLKKVVQRSQRDYARV